MGSTNKTSNYGLSQYIDTDKPTYLSDYNSDMLKIDQTMKENSDAATEANTNAGSALSKAESVEQSVSQNATDIETLEGKMSSVEGTLSTHDVKITNTTQTANEALDQAKQAIDELKTFDWTTVTVQASVGDTDKDVYIAYNAGMHLLSLFCNVGFNSEHTFSSGDVLFTIPQSIMNMLNISQDRTLRIVEYLNYTSDSISGNPKLNGLYNLTLKTDGRVMQVQPRTGCTYFAINSILNAATWM